MKIKEVYEQIEQIKLKDIETVGELLELLLRLEEETPKRTPMPVPERKRRWL